MSQTEKGARGGEEKGGWLLSPNPVIKGMPRNENENKERENEREKERNRNWEGRER